LLAIGLGLAWRAAIWPLNQDSAPALERRAQLFWDFRLAGDPASAYDYMMESYRRRVTPSAFASGGGMVVYTGAQVKGITLDDKGGLVDIEIKYRIARKGFSDLESTSVIKERWVLENGAWYRWPPELGG
jgi:hypothetical protein